MKRNRCVAPILALVLTTICAHPSKLAGQANRDALRLAMAKRIDEAKQGTGAVVGLITPQGKSFATYGRVSLEGPEATPDTIFEIGSITKVFTSFLLGDMVERGEVMLDDPVRRFLPSSVTMPSRNGKQITLVDLATQTSGLPRDSVKVDLTATTSPYADYSANQLYAFLRSIRLDRDPGSKYEYSNVGMGLLGHALALRAGISYEDLLRRRIFEPLGMTSTTITLNAEHRARRATGYNVKLLALPPWTGGVIDPAGSINSTASDMLKFGAAMVDSNSPLKGAFARMTSVRRPSDGPRSDQVLGWGIFKLGSNELVGHSGGTFGFQSRLIVDLTRKRSVVAWINNGQGDSVTDLVGLALDRASLQ
jgi:CubicO group peptidase (beta-lactamase class C family)